MLSEALSNIYKNSIINTKKFIDFIFEIHQFLTKIGHSFDEIIGQDRVYSFDTDDHNENEEFSSETQVYYRKNAYDRLYPPRDDNSEESSEFEKLGIIQFDQKVVRTSNVYVNFNWLHFIT